MTAAWTTPAKTWVTGDPITASELNTHVRDNMDYLNQELVAKLGAWTSYTPTLTQNAAVAKTVTYSRYNKIGRRVIFECYLVTTATGTANNIVKVSLPFTCAGAAGMPIGGTFYIVSGGNFVGHAILDSTGTAVQGLISGSTTFMGQTGGGFTAALANPASVLCAVAYESTT